MLTINLQTAPSLAMTLSNVVSASGEVASGSPTENKGRLQTNFPVVFRRKTVIKRVSRMQIFQQ